MEGGREEGERGREVREGGGSVGGREVREGGREGGSVEEREEESVNMITTGLKTM